MVVNLCHETLRSSVVFQFVSVSAVEAFIFKGIISTILVADEKLKLVSLVVLYLSGVQSQCHMLIKAVSCPIPLRERRYQENFEHWFLTTVSAFYCWWCTNEVSLNSCYYIFWCHCWLTFKFNVDYLDYPRGGYMESKYWVNKSHKTGLGIRFHWQMCASALPVGFVDVLLIAYSGK